LGRFTTDKEIERAAELIIGEVLKLRESKDNVTKASQLEAY
jgi:hypothetical protein